VRSRENSPKTDLDAIALTKRLVKKLPGVYYVIMEEVEACNTAGAFSRITSIFGG
jgi:hypothetical protein